MQALAGRTTGALPLILAGVAVSSLAAALTSLALNLSPNPFAALEIVFWMMGSLADRSLEHVWLAAPFMLVGCALLRSEEHTSELQSLMRISYAVFCLKKKT